MQNYNTQPLPLISQKPFPDFFLEHLLQGIYGVDAPDNGSYNTALI